MKSSTSPKMVNLWMHDNLKRASLMIRQVVAMLKTSLLGMEVVMLKQKHFPVVIQQDEDGVFILTCPLFSGCHSYGHSIEEGMVNITEAIEACLEDELDEPRAQFVGVRDLQLAI